MRIIPNAIAVIRGLALIPVIVLLDQGSTTWALGVFTAAALTDAVDGPLARRLGAASRLGAFLDPLADKILILGTLVAMLGRGPVMEWMVVVLLAREVLAIGLRAIAAGRGGSLAASASGKTKTIVQAVAVALSLQFMATPSAALGVLSDTALLGAVALTLASGVDLLARSLDLTASRSIGAHAR